MRHPIPLVLLAATLAMTAPALSQGIQEAPEGNPLNAVVKLEVVTAKSNIYRPWQTITGGGDGTGVVIASGRILTCAHCVADSSYIRVRKHDEDSLYHATVEFIDNDCDLALIRVDDPAFMTGVVPMEIGETPAIQSDVLAVGYPIGGNDISFTRGIVSRIEDTVYVHGWKNLLAAQVDAAINPGNSGGPVLDLETGLIGGIAFQGDKDGEALGYMIPTEIIRHFLDDTRDGRVDGFSDVLFDLNHMESEAKRRFYRMEKDQTGVVITDAPKALGEDSVRADDILLEVDGLKVSNNGRVRIKDNEPRSLHYPIYMRQLGETIPVKVLRDGAVVETSIRAMKRDQRTRRWMFDVKPDYFLYGGLVFTSSSYNYLTAAKAHFHDDVLEDKAFADDEAVVISDLLVDTCMEGYIGIDDSLVRTVNGEKVRNLRHLVELVEGCREGFVLFGLDCNEEWDTKMVVDVKEMIEATPRVMERYQVPADRSEDLRSK